jgi:hopanoid biosynthesis associated radical SAM protein HpnH
VSIPGGEPLIHKDIVEIVEGIVAKKRFVYLCTNALLVKKKIDDFTPSPYLTFSIHLDGLEEHHDRSVCQEGVFDTAVEAINLLRARGFRVNINTTLFDGVSPDEVSAFFDYVSHDLDVEGITVSPGYAYERAPDQEHFLNRKKTKELFRSIFSLGEGKKWKLNHSSLYLDFLAGNQQYHCTPWGNPTRNIFGWQRPCYLLGEGFAPSFKELMETTDWDRYGTGNYEKCADCMAHCGYEPTAVNDAIGNPLKTFFTAIRKTKTDGDMVPDISLANQRAAEDVFEKVTTAANSQLSDDNNRGKKSVYKSKAVA